MHILAYCTQKYSSNAIYCRVYVHVLIGSDIYLGMSPIQNGGFYLMY